MLKITLAIILLFTPPVFATVNPIQKGNPAPYDGFLFDQPSFDEADIQSLSLVTGERKSLVKGGTNAHYLRSGHLIYFRAGVMMAVTFNAEKLEVNGSPFPMLDHVMENPRSGAGQLSVSRDGTLVYIPGGTSIGDHELVYVDKATRAVRTLTPKRRPYEDFTASWHPLVQIEI